MSPERGPGTCGPPSPELKPHFWGSMRLEPESTAATVHGVFEASYEAWWSQKPQILKQLSGFLSCGEQEACVLQEPGTQRGTRADVCLHSHAGALGPLWLMTDEPSQGCGARTQSKQQSRRLCHKQAGRGSGTKTFSWTRTHEEGGSSLFLRGRGSFCMVAYVKQSKRLSRRSEPILNRFPFPGNICKCVHGCAWEHEEECMFVCVCAKTHKHSWWGSWKKKEKHGLLIIPHTRVCACAHRAIHTRTPIHLHFWPSLHPHKLLLGLRPKPTLNQ